MEIRDRILIVEDDPSITNLLSAILKANNYQIMTAAGGGYLTPCSTSTLKM